MKAPCIDAAAYRMLTFDRLPRIERGDQSLLQLEIAACFLGHAARTIWLPFPLGSLGEFLASCGMRVTTAGYAAVCSDEIDGMYAGTPTLVDGEMLFPECHPEQWDLEKERRVMRYICREASRRDAHVIITGLGSGDISVNDRISDMSMEGWSLPLSICTKRFDGFNDDLIATVRR